MSPMKYTQDIELVEETIMTNKILSALLEELKTWNPEPPRRGRTEAEFDMWKKWSRGHRGYRVTNGAIRKVGR